MTVTTPLERTCQVPANNRDIAVPENVRVFIVRDDE